MGSPPFNPISKLNTARGKARRTRAGWLLAIDGGLVTVVDMVKEAAASPASPLRNITLVEALRSTPGWSPRRAKEGVATVRRLTRVPRSTPDSDLTIGWSVDGRTNPVTARRRTALADVLYADERESPNPRFPWF